MDFKEIISITGKPGLFKVLAHGKGAVIVEDIISKKRFPAHARHKISTLEDISIYTYEEDVPLTEVYQKMAEHLSYAECLNHKEDFSKLEKELKNFLPDYDQDRVYESDIRKLFQWYNLLVKAGLMKKPAAKKAAESKPKAEGKSTEESKAKTATKKPAAKKKPSAAAPKKMSGAPKAAAGKKTVQTPRKSS